MELSTTANWLGVIGGFVAAMSWSWKIWLWLQYKLQSAKEQAATGAELAHLLLDNATSSSRRADIHSFILFRCIEIESFRTQQLFTSVTMGVITTAVGISLMVTNRIFDVEAIYWLWLMAITAYSVGLIAFFTALFFNHQIKQIHNSWQSNARALLAKRAYRHLPDRDI